MPAVNAEAANRQRQRPGTAWTVAPRTPLGSAPREHKPGEVRPSGAGRAPAADPAAAIGAATPSEATERLIQLTEELGRLAGEIADGASAADAAPILDAEFVRAVIRARRQRAVSFGADLFADPAWDMMLDLLAARFEGRGVRTSSLCIAAGVPGTTALRWIRELTARGLFVRVADPLDGRGVLIALSDDAAERMIAHLTASQQGVLA
jgi:hypothetical protein